MDPGRRSAAAAGLAALVAALLAGGWLMLARPHAAPLPELSSGSATRTPATAAVAVPSVTAATTAAVVVVHVAGKVRHPGLYRLPSGARVDDALRAAGGTLPGADLSGLNLARKLADGEQLPVGITGAGPAITSGPAGSSVIDLNAATLDQLDTLPGVGPVLAQHILDWRTAHGRFETVDQLREVSGIGEAKFAEIRDRVRI